MSISPWDELQELAADKYVARELEVSEWRLAEGDGYPLSSNRNRFEFLMWAQIRAIIEQVATLTAELQTIKEKNRMNTLQELYDSEINFKIETFWQGIEWKLGDVMNGWKAEGSADSVDEAVKRLAAAAMIHYPESVFAEGKQR